MIEESTLFSALHSELNARIGARAAANIAHMQTIALFASAAAVAMFGETDARNFAELSSRLYYFITAFMPLISFYFLSIYEQQDRQIGLLNRHLRLIEGKSKLIKDSLKFFPRRTETGVASYTARFQAHMAVTGLGCSSYLIYSIAYINDALPEPPTWGLMAYWACCIITLINVLMMVRLELFRRWLIRNESQYWKFWDLISPFIK